MPDFKLLADKIRKNISENQVIEPECPEEEAFVRKFLQQVIDLTSKPFTRSFVSRKMPEHLDPQTVLGLLDDHNVAVIQRRTVALDKYNSSQDIANSILYRF